MRKLSRLRRFWELLSYYVKSRILLLFNIIYIPPGFLVDNKIHGYELWFHIKDKNKKQYTLNVDHIKKYYKKKNVKKLLEFCGGIQLDLIGFLHEYKPNELVIQFSENQYKLEKLINAFIIGTMQWVSDEYDVIYTRNAISLINKIGYETK